jgi:hypothetical protein
METSESGAVGGRMGTMEDPKWVKEADEEIRERAGETGWEIGMMVGRFARGLNSFRQGEEARSVRQRCALGL